MNIPTYSVADNGNGTCFFECTCGMQHVHGLPKNDQPEHRIAHCVDPEVHPCGYYIAQSNAFAMPTPKEYWFAFIARHPRLSHRERMEVWAQNPFNPTLTWIGSAVAKTPASHP